MLGLDLGPSSIGWALVDAESQSIVDMGVRVFPEGVDNFDSSKEVSRNESRRTARAMRRQHQRRARRKRALEQALVECGLWPSDSSEAEALKGSLDPYELRAAALDRPLEPFELGRVFLHLGARRGFLSNRKKDRGDSEVQGMLAEIAGVEADIQASECRTLGEWLWRRRLVHMRAGDGNRSTFDAVMEHPIRGLHLRRSQYETEFEAIWTAQQRHHRERLTEQLKLGRLGARTYPTVGSTKHPGETLLELVGLHGLIFFQRPMYWPRSVIGACELEPREKRCPRSDRAFQRFRIYQEVANLRYSVDGTRDELVLTDDERSMLIEKLMKKERLTFNEIRKAMGLLESARFNLERGERASLRGSRTDHLMSRPTTGLGKAWHAFEEDLKDRIVRIVLDTESSDQDSIERLVSECDLTRDQAIVALGIDLPAGYGHLSLKAIEKLNPHLREGCVYMADGEDSRSALHAAGYLRRDQLQRRIFGRLPNPDRASNTPVSGIPNPVVRRALTELRKVVNAIIREYGKPASIHVEMARSLKMGPKKRSEYNRQAREREKERDAAADAIREQGERVTREKINRYLLWRRQGCECLYSGRMISVSQLFGGEIDVDHILPYSRSLDDSQANKVVCFRDANHQKGNQTPYEWLAGSNPTRYDEICQRASRLMKSHQMSYGTYRRFMQKDLELDEFIARQLVDTAYISRAAGEYLRCLFDDGSAVLGLKGNHTAELRRHWGLNQVLRQDGLDLKNREDHRHHAVDAVVIALTDRKRLQHLSRIRRDGGTYATGEILPMPWESLRRDVEARVNSINISFRVERKVPGRLHEETAYGPTETSGVWAVRKDVTSLSAAEIERIRDPAIRQIIIQRLQESGIAFGRGTALNAKAMREALADLRMPSGVPIKSVRILKPELTVQAVGGDEGASLFVKPGSTHHLCIFEFADNGTTKREAVFVTTLEAARRAKRGRPIVDRRHPRRPDAKFVMSLSRGEIVLGPKGGREPMAFNTAASTQGQIYFHSSRDARVASMKKKTVVTANSMSREARKVTIDPLGRIRWAND